VITLLKSNAKLRAEFDAHVKDDVQRVTRVSSSDDSMVATAAVVATMTRR
jgi:hypothetical protein